MHVLATAGHVDHGKSTLVQALTGSDPDRLAEEKRRGLTIELGFAWTTLPGGTEVAFVDVPGHQRFLSTTVAGMGPVPAVMFVVAADEGWRRQSGEHLAALDALGVERGLLVITRSDLADPTAAAEQAQAAMDATSLKHLPWLGVSARTGAGLDELRRALVTLTASLPTPPATGAIRLWVDRSFTVAGTGTVVTGTLGSGTVTVGDELHLAGERVTVRSIESLGQPHTAVHGTARVALGLRGVDRDEVGRGDALLSPGWRHTDTVDVRIARQAELPTTAVLHIGSAHVPARVRQLSPTHARVTLARALPLEIGDRALLRDPGAQHVTAGLVVVDLEPPAFTRRGAAAARAGELAQRGDRPDAALETGRRRITTRAELVSRGALAHDDPLPHDLVEVAGRILTTATWDGFPAQLRELVTGQPSGVPREVARARLDLPSTALLDAVLARVPELTATRDGRIAERAQALPPNLATALATLTTRWRVDPLDAPDAEQLRATGLDDRALGALAARGELVRLSREVAVAPTGPTRAADVLAGLPQPFTVSAARQALGSSRRVVVPLLEHLDRAGVTHRDADGMRQVVNRR